MTDEMTSMDLDDVVDVEVDNKHWQQWLQHCYFVREELEQQQQSPVFDCYLNWLLMEVGSNCLLLDDDHIVLMDVHVNEEVMLDDDDDNND